MRESGSLAQEGMSGRGGGRGLGSGPREQSFTPDRTRVLFADTHDRIGPLGAKSMSESPYNPVTPALANAIRDAAGARLTATPFAPDRIFRTVMAAVAKRGGSTT